MPILTRTRIQEATMNRLVYLIRSLSLGETLLWACTARDEAVAFV